MTTAARPSPIALSEPQVRQALTNVVGERIVRLECFPEIGSTSTYLLEDSSPPIGKWHVAIADRQSAGRGRSGKRWHSPSGGGLWLSGACTLPTLPRNVSALTLATGVGVVKALHALGARDLMLKWPNDILSGHRKLGGILLDTTQAGGANLTVVMGLGINVDIAGLQGVRKEIARNGDLDATDLRSAVEKPPTMPVLAAAMITALVETTDLYVKHGFDAFTNDWARLDGLRGRRVVVNQQEARREGLAVGVAENGALILQDGDHEHHIVSGTVRPVGNDGAVA